jgi:hypothetical protein
MSVPTEDRDGALWAVADIRAMRVAGPWPRPTALFPAVAPVAAPMVLAEMGARTCPPGRTEALATQDPEQPGPVVTPPRHLPAAPGA